MFRRFILWLSHLWAQLCEFTMPSRRITQTPSTPAPGAVATTTNPQTQPTFVSTSTPTRWDVFLSFRGKDTRLNFTSHLYDKLGSNGIGTFMDDPELRSGEVISDTLLDSIRNSKAYIVVFSENYATSPWCLNELVEILNCHKTAQRLVIPVFYKIDPSVIRYQTGSFGQAFKKHQKHFRGEREKVDNWRFTLKQVADLSGHHISKDRSEADVINEIVDELLRIINPKTLDVDKFEVGLDYRVEAITRMLSSDTKGVIKFGIYGMGGVGKTTLAKAVFNQLVRGGRFKGSCFLPNVREASGTFKGLESLQKKLINDVLKSKNIVEVGSVEEGVKLIENRICSAKVLVLIDDIYDLEQYESLAGPFASGSVVIITTRDEEMLEKVSVEPTYRYMLKELDYAQSYELFTQYAFEKAEPTNNLLALCKDILGLAGGLPLALKIFGSYLSTKEEVEWKSYIETLQQYPNSTIEQKLLISLDALERDDCMLKKIFIDIACFFVGWKKEVAVEVLETYYSYADVKINTLKKRCLLTVNEEKLEMHDLLRDTGRNVARNKAPDEPGKYSRLWLPEDIEDVLKNHKGTEAVEGIIPYNFYNQSVLVGKSFTTETFKWMRKLRFLYFWEVNLTGNFEQMFEDLRVLHWERCPLKCLPSEFYPPKLVILELPYSKLRTVWEQNMVSHVFGKLKTLNMSYSRDLVATPDFTRLPSLETLNLEWCESLEEVHISIGSLERLDSLNLKGCEKLRSLPDTICDLRALKVLNISKCNSLEALPLQLGNIKSLTKLNAGKLSVSKLPESIGDLNKLIELDLSENKNLESLPNTICNLRALKVLRIDNCSNVKALPVKLGNIESLKKLGARFLSVSKLPDSIGSLAKLVELDLSQNKNLETLPDTIGNLRSLETLSIENCEKLQALPDELWKITRLRKLYARHAKLLKKLPDIGSGQIALSLQELSLSSTGIITLPSGFSQLSNLQSLYITECDDLLFIPKLPPNLKRIVAFSCRSLERLPNLSNLKQLEELDISYCRGLTKIQGLEDLISIRELNLNGCLHLTVWHLSKRLFKVYSELGHQINVHVPEFVYWSVESPYWTLKANEYPESTTVYAHLLPNESHNFMGIILCFQRPARRYIPFSVKNTTSGFIWWGAAFFSLNGLLMVIVPKSIFSVTDDDHRIELTAHDNVEFVGIHLLYNVETETIEDVMEQYVILIDKLKLFDPVLPDIFIDIACFFIGWQKKRVVQILETYYTNVDHHIDILKTICLLKINDQDKLEMDDLCQNLGRKLACNNSLEESEKLSRLWRLTDIYDALKKHKGTEVIEGIVPHEGYLWDRDDALTGESFTLETFEKMSKLRFLYLRKVPHVFRKLKTLNMSDSQGLTTTPDFTKLPCLETLNLWGCKSLEEVHISIGSLVRLVSIDLHGCIKLRSLPNTICNLRTLEELDISGCSCLEALPMALGNIQSLRELNAGNLTVSVLPDSIGQLSELVKLRLSSNKNLKTLPVTICNLRSLEILDISGCEKLEILLDQLCKVTSLRELIASGATFLKEFPYVESSQMALSLQKLDFSGSDLTALLSGISNLSNLEDLNLEYCCCLLSIAELPRNLKWIRANGCMSMERLPNLSNLKQLEHLDLEDCSGLTEIEGLTGLTSIRRLHLKGCNSSLLTYIFTEGFFQMYSEFGHPVQICSTEFPDWIRQSIGWEKMYSNLYFKTMSFNLAPNVSHNYLGMILCIISSEYFTSYSVQNTTSHFIWSGEYRSFGDKSLMVIVPKSTFSVEDGDDRIILDAHGVYDLVYGIHLLYKTEEYESTTVNEN